MAITPLPSLDRTSATFKTDVDTFFATQLPTFSSDINDLAIDVEDAATTSSAAAVTATTQAGIASSAAASATISASTATTKAGEALTSAGVASTGANTATAQANVATTQAGIATTQAAAATAAAAGAQAIVLNVSTNYPVIRPSLNLDFSNSKFINERITATRASTGTYYGADGVMRSAAVNEMRIDHDPATGECKGVLIEGASTNLVTNSEEMAAGTGTLVTSNAVIAPDRSLTGDFVYDNTATGEHFVIDRNVPAVAGTIYTWSVFVKDGPSANRYLYLRAAGAASATLIFNPRTGLIQSTSGGGYLSSDVTTLRDGWFRVWITFVCQTTGSLAARIQLLGGELSVVYQGDGTSGLYPWGAQLEPGTLVQENTGTATGTTTAVTLSAGSATADAYVGKQLVVNGEYRYITAYNSTTKVATVAALTVGPTGTYVVNSYIPYLSSYIPTTSAAATRAADLVSMTGKNFSDWYNQSEGTFVCEFDRNITAGATTLSISDGTTSNSLAFLGGNAVPQQQRFDVLTSGVIQAQLLLTSAIVSGVKYKVSSAYKNNDLAASFEGETCVTAGNAIIPGVNRLYFGAGGSGTVTLNGHISRVAYYQKRLTNLELQTLSTN